MKNREIRINVHRQTEGHLELATGGTTSVFSSAFHLFLVNVVACGAHAANPSKLGQRWGEATYEIFAILTVDLDTCEGIKDACFVAGEKFEIRREIRDAECAPNFS
jgi:hypothetical protein